MRGISSTHRAPLLSLVHVSCHSCCIEYHFCSTSFTKYSLKAHKWCLSATLTVSAPHREPHTSVFRCWGWKGWKWLILFSFFFLVGFLEPSLCRETKRPSCKVIVQAWGWFFSRSVWCCCWINIQQLRDPRDDRQLLQPEDTTLGGRRASKCFSTSPLCFYLQEWQTFMLLSIHTRLHSRNTPEQAHILQIQGEFSVPMSVDAIWPLTLLVCPQWVRFYPPRFPSFGLFLHLCNYLLI